MFVVRLVRVSLASITDTTTNRLAYLEITSQSRNGLTLLLGYFYAGDGIIQSIDKLRDWVGSKQPITT